MKHKPEPQTPVATHLQKMGLPDMEKYLGQQATVIQEVKQLQREMGTLKSEGGE